MKIMIGIFACLFLFACLSQSWALQIDLWDWAFNVDGTTYEHFMGDTLPGYFDDSGFDWTEGLGTISINYDPGVASAHFLIGFFDHEIDEAVNTYWNEYGEDTGIPGATRSWEIDEPGYVFGDIYWNVLAGSLDNTNGVPEDHPDDVSMALGWDFTLDTGQSAVITFNTVLVEPLETFYLAQVDPDSDATLYFYSTLILEGGPGPAVPEPSTILLLASGLGGMIAYGFRRKKA